MKDRKWGLLILFGLLAYAFYKAKPTLAAALPPLGPPPSPPTTQDVGKAIEEAAIEGKSTVTVPTSTGGQVTYNVPSITQASQATGLTPTEFLDVYQQGQVSPAVAEKLGLGQIVNTPTATGVYEAALPEQERLRQEFIAQHGYEPPPGGYFRQTLDGTIYWQSDVKHPVYGG